MPRSDPEPSKFARYRANKRAGGKKLLRMWVRDPNTPEFQEEMARQVALLKDAPEQTETLDFFEAIEREDDRSG
jgi:hypothetical protein